MMAPTGLIECRFLADPRQTDIRAIARYLNRTVAYWFDRTLTAACVDARSFLPEHR